MINFLIRTIHYKIDISNKNNLIENNNTSKSLGGIFLKFVKEYAKVNKLKNIKCLFKIDYQKRNIKKKVKKLNERIIKFVID